MTGYEVEGEVHEMHEHRAGDWDGYQKMTAAILEDVSKDTDEILCKMQELGGTHMGDSFDSGLLAGMLNNKGIDPGIVAMLNDRNRDGGFGNGGGDWIILLFLFLLGIGGGGFGNGFGRNGLTSEGLGVAGVDRTVVNEANYSRLMDAISTTGTRQEMAINALATNLNCDVGQIKAALCGVDKQIALAQGDLKSAIQSCCCTVRQEVAETKFELSKQISDCCCQTNRAIERQGCDTRAQIQDLTYNVASQFAAQTNQIQQAFCNQNAYLADQFCQIKQREDAREIQQLRDQIAQQRTEAQTALLLNAVNGNRFVSARYDTTDQTICGTVGPNCCCN